MSKTIQFVFIQNQGGISELIEFVEELDNKDKQKFTPTHCGIIVDGLFQEAITSGFVGNRLDRYPKDYIRIYDVVIENEEDIQRGDAKFKELLGQKYSYKALICGAAYSIFGMILPGTSGENDCSGCDTEVGRAYGLDIRNDVPASCITPEILMEIIEQYGTLHELEA